MTAADEEGRRRAERARRVALFRYELTQDVIDARLSSQQRGPLVRAIAAREHDGPFGEKGRGVAADHRPVVSVVESGRVRRTGAQPGEADPADPGRGAGPSRR